MFPKGRGLLNPNISPPLELDFVENFRKAREIAEKAGRKLIYSGARLNVVTNTFCQAAGKSCAITPEGWVTSCYEVLDNNDPLAKIFFYGYYDPVKRSFIIDEERRRNLFNLSVINKESCSKCFCKWHCAGDCPAKSIYK